MQLTDKQQEGLKIAVERYRANAPYTVISGYAGTGKSTLIKFIVSALELNPDEDVAYITFTGKASEVLRSKGCKNAMTAHKLLYYSKQMPNGKYVYKPRPILESQYKLIVVDEVSMLPSDMWELLLSHKIYVLATGDPFQLPPINKKLDNHVLDIPHIFLDEVMRQAKESDIITTSMDIRAGKKLSKLSGNDIQIFNKQDFVDGMYSWADQIIVATNKQRQEINDYVRKDILQLPDYPSIGDKLICLQNCWEILSNKGNPLINGSIVYIKEIIEGTRIYNLNSEIISVPVFYLTLENNDETFYCCADKKALVEGIKTFTPE